MNRFVSLRIAMLCTTMATSAGCVSQNAVDYLPPHIRAEAAYADAARGSGPAVIINLPEVEPAAERTAEPARPAAAPAMPQGLDRLLAETAGPPEAPPPVGPPALRLRSILPGDGTEMPAVPAVPRGGQGGGPGNSSGTGSVTFRSEGSSERPDPAGLRTLSDLVRGEPHAAVVLSAGAPANAADFESLMAARRRMQAIAAVLPSHVTATQRIDTTVPADEIRAVLVPR